MQESTCSEVFEIVLHKAGVVRLNSNGHLSMYRMSENKGCGSNLVSIAKRNCKRPYNVQETWLCIKRQEMDIVYSTVSREPLPTVPAGTWPFCAASFSSNLANSRRATSSSSSSTCWTPWTSSVYVVSLMCKCDTARKDEPM